MRLIDADVFAESLIYCKGLGRKSMEAVLKSLNEQPTAYDVEKVVADIKSLSGYEIYKNTFDLIIEIVRKGGIDEIPMDESYK